MIKLTKQDIQAIHKADDIVVYLDANNPTGLVKLIKRRDWNKPFSEDQDWVINATASIDSGFKDGIHCFAMCNVKQFHYSGASSIMATLRAGDECNFRFWPDAHTNKYTANADLHGDVLYLDVRRDGKLHRTWEFEHSICPDNTARMCKGVGETQAWKYAKSA